VPSASATRCWCASYVLGGRAMEIVYDEDSLRRYMHAVKASPNHPVLIDRFLEHATEIDVDAICDGDDVYIGAVMQHVEERACTRRLSLCDPRCRGDAVVQRIEEQTAALAKELGVVGLMNVQYAFNRVTRAAPAYTCWRSIPRLADVPFVSKATACRLRGRDPGDRRPEVAGHEAARLGESARAGGCPAGATCSTWLSRRPCCPSGAWQGWTPPWARR